MLPNISGSIYAVDWNVFPLQKVILVIGGNGDDSILPYTQVITDDLKVLTGVVPDPPVENVGWTAQYIGRIVAAFMPHYSSDISRPTK